MAFRRKPSIVVVEDDDDFPMSGNHGSGLSVSLAESLPSWHKAISRPVRKYLASTSSHIAANLTYHPELNYDARSIVDQRNRKRTRNPAYVTCAGVHPPTSLAITARQEGYLQTGSQALQGHGPSTNTGAYDSPIEIPDDDISIIRNVHTSAIRIQDGSWNKATSVTSQPLAGLGPLISLDDEEEVANPVAVNGQVDLVAPLQMSKSDAATDATLVQLDLLNDDECPGMHEPDAYFDNESQNPHSEISTTSTDPHRNLAIKFPAFTVTSYDYNGLQLRPGTMVELQDGDFLRIKHIIVNSETDDVKMRGHRLQRTKDLNGMLEKKLNEIVLCLEVDLDDPREPMEQAMVEFGLSDIVRLRSTRFTTKKFPGDRNVNPSDYYSQIDAARDGGLTARWKYTCYFSSASHRMQNTYKERALERLTGHDVEVDSWDIELIRRFGWRGDTVRGGAYRPSFGNQKNERLATSSSDNSTAPSDAALTQIHVLAKRKYSFHMDPPSKRYRQTGGSPVEEARRKLSGVRLQAEKPTAPMVVDLCQHDAIMAKESSLSAPINLTSSSLCSPPLIGELQSKTPLNSSPFTRLAGQKYTYGDAFCGAGGATRGAVMAGLRVVWGFDMFDNACKTWRQNFPQAKLYELEANQFIQIAKQGADDMMKVDILHLSPPCQFFSPAHTVDGKHDESNVASLFAVQSVIEASKARVVTLEQTFGLAQYVRFRQFLNAVIQMFTIHDFSVRWAIVPLAQWGLPQRRRRLIIIASCPGEILPQMPAPTHARNGAGGLKPFTSVASALASIPHNAPHHDTAAQIFAGGRKMLPYDANDILPRAMTCHGGQNYHPSGKRGLTLREYAALQGFPSGHVFAGHYVKKQIGNAVPPSVAKVLFESIKKDLERADGIVEGPELIE